MAASGYPPESNDLLLRTGLEWVGKLISGTATVADAKALGEWRAQSSRHEAAFADAVDLLHALRADPGVLAKDTLAFLPKGRTSVRRIGRRALLGGALAAASAGVLVVRPAFRLWPSLAEMSADYRTRTGERHQVDLADGSHLDMNTWTSVSVRKDAGGHSIELVGGEAVVSVPTSNPLVVIAGDGRTIASHARFTLRYFGSVVRVTGLDGEVKVESRASSLMLKSGEQVSYDDQGVGHPVSVDPTVVTAWQRGVLVFRDTPLGSVIEEVNRYRSGGKIFITRSALADRPVNAVFHLDALQGVIALVEKMGARVTTLPGNVVLLG